MQYEWKFSASFQFYIISIPLFEFNTISDLFEKRHKAILHFIGKYGRSTESDNC